MKIDSTIPQDEEDPLYGSLTFPIYQTSSFLLPKGEKYRYSRENNPTVEALSRKIAVLEGFPAGNSFSSGMASITATLLTFLRPGKTIMIQRQLFARSYRFITSYLKELGIKVLIAEPGTDGVVKLLDRSVDMLFLESITNPLLRVNDVAEIAEKCSETGTLFVVDSTFSTPYNLKSGEYGISVALHSASKFISGHNDIIAGVLAGKPELVDKIDLMRRNLGSSMDPHAAFLVMRGLKTLGLRMGRINSSALKVAEQLSELKGIKRVLYPGLDNHPDHDTARKLLKGYGGVVTIDLGTGKEKTLQYLGRLKMIMPANTLGGLTTTVTHPSTMSHRGLSQEEQEKAGITPGMARISVGIEDPEDVLNDLKQALK